MHIILQKNFIHILKIKEASLEIEIKHCENFKMKQTKAKCKDVSIIFKSNCYLQTLLHLLKS